jgi:hypothetical protein
MMRTILAGLILAMLPVKAAGVIESTGNVFQEAGLSDLYLGFRPRQVKLGPQQVGPEGAVVRRGFLELGDEQRPERHAVEMTYREGCPHVLSVDGDGDGRFGTGEKE